MSLDRQPASGELLGMSDEDFANLNGPPEAGEQIAEVEDKDKDKPTETDVAPAEATTDTGEQVEAGTEPAATVEAETVEAAGEKEPEAAAEGEDKTKEPEKKPEASPSGSPEGGVVEPTPEQASTFFKQVMAPFKANGKTIQLKTPEEAIQLMQMGANYTRKLQDIQPHRKVLLMLQNNDLLDEGKLSFLIDLEKKNPEAIKKLIKDAGIDPMDIDTATDPAYSEGHHLVTDEEAGFRQALDDMTSTQSGQETVRLIHAEWDQASKEALFKSPEIMSVIHGQRENGIYDVIAAEMDRQKTLGSIAPNTPFLEAYKIVGDQLAAAGTFGEPKPKQEEAPTVVATTTAAPKSPVANGDKANAASPTRTTPRKVEKLVNPLAMSDDEFLNNFQNRL